MLTASVYCKDKPGSSLQMSQWGKPNTTWCLLRRHHRSRRHANPTKNKLARSEEGAKPTTNRNPTNRRGRPAGTASPRTAGPGTWDSGHQILFQPTARREVPVLTSTSTSAGSNKYKCASNKYERPIETN